MVTMRVTGRVGRVWWRGWALGWIVISSGCEPVQAPIHVHPASVDMSIGIGGNGGEDAGFAYGTDLAVVGSMCSPQQMPTQCHGAIAANAGCGPVEDCGPTGSGNGADDNCNGVVDEGCSCRPGSVERCF